MGTGSLNQLVLDKENAGYRIFEAVDSNPFGFKSGLALSLSLSLSLSATTHSENAKNSSAYGEKNRESYVYNNSPNQ